MNLPKAPKVYSVSDQDTARDLITQADRKTIKKGDTIYFKRNEVVISSPDGSLWALTVDDAGAISTEARS